MSTLWAIQRKKVIRFCTLAHTVYLYRHNEVVLGESADGMRGERDGDVFVVVDGNIRMVTLGFRQLPHLVHERKRFFEIFEQKLARDTFPVLLNRPIRRLLSVLCHLFTIERRHAAFSPHAFFLCQFVHMTFSLFSLPPAAVARAPPSAVSRVFLRARNCGDRFPGSPRRTLHRNRKSGSLH